VAKRTFEMMIHRVGVEGIENLLNLEKVMSSEQPKLFF